MSSDVEKLREVVQSLETEASNMNAFNGVLNSLKATNEEILTAKREVLQLAEEQRLFIEKMKKKWILSAKESLSSRITSSTAREMLFEKDFLETPSH